MSDNGQKRFSNPREHIFLKPETKKRMQKTPTKKRKKGHFPHSSTVEYSKLANQVQKIVQEKRAKKPKILEYPRIHFLMELSDSITWKQIATSIQKMELAVIEYVTDKQIRVSVEKASYEKFLKNLEENHKFVQEIRQIGPSEKIEENLQKEIVSSPEGKNWVTVEFSSVSGIENADMVTEALELWIEREHLGTLKKSYQSMSTLLLSGLLINRAISAIVEEVEPLSFVAKIPKMQLKTFEMKAPRET